MRCPQRCGRKIQPQDNSCDLSGKYGVVQACRSQADGEETEPVMEHYSPFEDEVDDLWLNSLCADFKLEDARLADFATLAGL